MNNNLSVDYAIHSDFLIHWTGKDIETHEWSNDPQSKTDPKTTDKYIERLRGILKHGFWMTEDTEEYPELDAPKVPQTCFTELRLSQARRHAKKFGRLGIGMKRFFVFNRGGRPLIYYGIKKNGNMVKDPLLEACKEQLKDKKLLNFFKQMHETREESGRYILNYDLYSESEWRILYMEQKEAEEPTYEYRNSLKKEENEKLKYLLPLDIHLGMIVYPSVDVKNKAFEDEEIRDTIKKIRTQKSTCEGLNWPIEIDLDACRNF